MNSPILSKAFLIAIGAFILVSCSEEPTNSLIDNRSTAEPSQTHSKISIDESGSIVKNEGWEVPHFPMSEQDFKSAPGESVTGPKPKTYSYYYLPNHQMLFAQPRRGADTVDSELRDVVSITVFKGKDQPPYCYRILTGRRDPNGNNSVGMLLQWFLSDMNGDGVFETYNDNCTTPDWVKRGVFVTQMPFGQQAFSVNLICSC